MSRAVKHLRYGADESIERLDPSKPGMKSIYDSCNSVEEALLTLKSLKEFFRENKPMEVQVEGESFNVYRRRVTTHACVMEIRRFFVREIEVKATAETSIVHEGGIATRTLETKIRYHPFSS